MAKEETKMHMVPRLLEVGGRPSCPPLLFLERETTSTGSRGETPLAPPSFSWKKSNPWVVGKRTPRPHGGCFRLLQQKPHHGDEVSHRNAENANPYVGDQPRITKSSEPWSWHHVELKRWDLEAMTMWSLLQEQRDHGDEVSHRNAENANPHVGD